MEVIEKIESKITRIDSKLESLEKQKALILENSLNNKRERERDEDELKIILNKIEVLLSLKVFWQNALKNALVKCGLSTAKIFSLPINDLKENLNSLPTPPKEGWGKVRLSDKTKFSLSIGKRVLDSELKPRGKIPVYSANVKKPFGFIDKEILSTYEKDSVLWGIDGDWLVGFVPKDTPFYPTDHCGVLRVSEGEARLVAYSLEYEGIQVGFSRTLRASIERISTLKILFPPIKAQKQITKTIENIESRITHLDSICPLLESKKQKILLEKLL